MPPTAMDTTSLTSDTAKHRRKNRAADSVQPAPPTADHALRSAATGVATKKKDKFGKRGRPRTKKPSTSTPPPPPQSPQATGEYKVNQMVNARAPSASPVAATVVAVATTKSPANTMLRQLQSDLSPKYTQASRPSPDSRCSRYGRHQKPAELTDCLDNEILNAVLRKSISESGSPPVKRSMTPLLAKTPTSRKQSSSVTKFIASTSTAGSPIANFISSASPSSSPPDYVSPIEKLLRRNRMDQCTASDYDGCISNNSGSPATEPISNVLPTGDDPRQVFSSDQLSRKSLIFDIDAASAVQPLPLRKPLFVMTRVASSGRSPVVAKIVADGTIKPQQQHVSPRRNKLLPLAPLFSETTAPKSSMPAVELAPAVKLAPAVELPPAVQLAPVLELNLVVKLEPAVELDSEIIEAEVAESEMPDIEAQITSFRVQKSETPFDDDETGRDDNDNDAEDTRPRIPTLSVLKNSSQCTYLKVEMDASLPPQPIPQSLPSPSTNDATLLPMPSSDRSDETLLPMPLNVIASYPLSASFSSMMGSVDEHKQDDISEHRPTLISIHKLDISYESETADDLTAIEQPDANPTAKSSDVTAAPQKDPSDRSASVDSGVDSAKGSSVGLADEPNIDWQVGQLVWARIGSYPYWPGITCASPDGQLFNHVQRQDRIQTRIHIRFLADNGRRCWVPTKDMVLFEGQADFQRMRSKMPANMKLTVLRGRGFVINNAQMPFWQNAVGEADMLRTFAVDRRLGVFEQTLEGERKPSLASRPKTTVDHRRNSVDSVYDITFSSLLHELERRQRTSTPVFSTSSTTTEQEPISTERNLKSLSLHADEEPADHKVLFYLHTLSEEADKAAMAAYEDNADFLAFYRQSIDNNFGTLEHAHEAHLKRLAMRKWMLKELGNSRMPAHNSSTATSVKSVRQSTTPGTPTNRANVSTVIKQPSPGALNTDSGAPVRRSVRDARSSVRTNFDEEKQKDLQQRHLQQAVEKSALRAQRMLEKEQRILAEMARYYMREHPKNILFRGMLKEPVCRLCLRPDSQSASQPAASIRRDQLRKCQTTTCNEQVHVACAAQMRAGRTSERIAELAAAQSKPSKKGGHRKKKGIIVHVTGDHEEKTMVNEDVGDEETDENGAVSGRSSTTSDRESTMSVLDYEEDIDDGDVYCPDCWPGREAVCFVCKQPADGTELRCTEKLCGRHYHEPCLKYWPQNRIASSDQTERQLLCPCHVCHICISDDPRSKHYHIKNSMLIRCVHCPATYHSDSSCVPAGSRMLTASQLICPRHRVESRRPVNANWCFICAQGGELICCETCPTAFHAECLRVALPDRYICEECETGRMPLYGELVWAKIGSCRWWPAVTVPPMAVPETVLAVKHRPHDFAIRFFGSLDYSWISRGFVFLYQDGDSECGDAVLPHNASMAGIGDLSMASSVDSSQQRLRPMDRTYQKALVQAKVWFERFREVNAEHCNPASDHLLKPLPYIKCKTNKAIAPVRLRESSNETRQVCECRETDEDPCGASCWNRVLQIECDPSTCRAGVRCQNQRFEKRLYPNLAERRMEGKGWGLVTNEAIAAGTFIIEYVGELINRAEFEKRIDGKQERKEEHYYFLTLSRELLIDAGPRGNSSRFINHSCEPNCETQVWQVRGNQRVGLFAVDDIEPNTELTFNYNLECIGELKKICHCGAKRCAGFIGAKYAEPVQISQNKLIKNAAGGNKKKSAKNKSKKKVAVEAASMKATKKTTNAKPAANTSKTAIGRPKGSTALKRRPSTELMTDDSENNRPEQPRAGQQGQNSKRMRMD